MSKRGRWIITSVLVFLVGCEQNPFAKRAAAGSSAAQAEPAPAVQLSDPGVLALVNSKPLTVETFQRRQTALPDDDAKGFMETFGSSRVIYRKPRTLEERRIFLEELLKEHLLVQEAVAVKLDRKPEVQQQLDDAKTLILQRELIRHYTEGVSVTDKEVEEYYNQFQAAYRDPERIRVRQLVLKTLQEAEAIRATAAQGGDVGQLARDYSVGPGKDQGGDVGWYIREIDRQLLALKGEDPHANVFFPQLEAVAFALEVGQVSQPAKGPDGNYYIVKLEERIPGKQRPLSELWDQIRTGLLIQKQQQSFQEQLDTLWKRAKVAINDQRLEQMH